MSYLLSCVFLNFRYYIHFNHCAYLRIMFVFLNVYKYYVLYVHIFNMFQFFCVYSDYLCWCVFFIHVSHLCKVPWANSRLGAISSLYYYYYIRQLASTKGNELLQTGSPSGILSFFRYSLQNGPYMIIEHPEVLNWQQNIIISSHLIK